jgi:hypothetical protein
MALGKQALKVALTQVGQKENPIGSNWGKPVKDYLASVGINFPASWCMAFVYWCFDQVSNKGANPLVKSGGVLNCWNNAKANRVLGEPQVGDIFIMDFGKGLGHTGIVLDVNENYIHTIEGNTNDSGSREGIMVCQKLRPKSKIKGYLRY